MMDIFDHLRMSFTDIMAGLVQLTIRLFEYSISISTREETWILVLVAAGLSILVMVMMRGKDGEGKAKKTSRKASKQAAKQAIKAKTANPAIDRAGDDLMMLKDIEKQMRALKESYETGRITLDVYTQESQALYNKAEKLN
jgi:hypothetical protein